MANKSLRSSVRNATPLGLVFELFNSDLNWEYCDYNSLFIC